MQGAKVLKGLILARSDSTKSQQKISNFGQQFSRKRKTEHSYIFKGAYT